MVPSAVTTSRPSTLADIGPCRAEPKNAAFCDAAPPTVATMPESGPKNGVRRPTSASASCSVRQVQPASAITQPSASSISTTRSSALMSRITVPGRVGP